VEIRRELEQHGAEIEVARDGSFGAALERLAARQVGSLLLEGGAALHRAAWDEQLVDFVRLYVAPEAMGRGGVPFLEDRHFATSDLIDSRVEPIGPDVLIEGYVHGSH
jgi:riboflavin biosynthesis pyrimidine reductase